MLPAVFIFHSANNIYFGAVMMELEKFTKKFADCFNQTDASLITPQTVFKNLEEWGSMLALIVIAMVDADYGKAITADDLKNAHTIADLFEIVTKK